MILKQQGKEPVGECAVERACGKMRNSFVAELQLLALLLMQCISKQHEKNVIYGKYTIQIVLY